MRQFAMARSSLRMRVVLIPAAILFLGMLAASGVTLLAARNRINSENLSGVTLGGQLVGYALEKMASEKNADDAFTRLRRELAHVRHIEVHYIPASPQMEVRHFERLPPDPAPPAWFLRLFDPPKLVKTFPVVIGDELRGTLLMSTYPADEVSEIWSGLLFFAEVLGGSSIAIVTLLYLAARFTLKPLHDLAAGLDRLEHGQFDALAEIKVDELRRIGEKFNHLAHSLARSEADKRFLIDRLMSVQDAERKELARELHDEFGASLFGIRAAASCIIEDAGKNAAAARDDIIEQAEAISGMADSIQKQNYRILDRIRPAVLHQMGLTDALRQLTDSWTSANRGIACSLALPQEQAKIDALLNEEQSLTSYRIVQECLTNVARHSKARSVRVALSLRMDAQGDAVRRHPELEIRVEDDGIGLGDDFRFGFGFLGMSERVRKLNGRLEVGKGSCGGTLISAFIPLGGSTAAGRSTGDAAAPAEV